LHYHVDDEVEVDEMMTIEIEKMKKHLKIGYENTEKQMNVNQKKVNHHSQWLHHQL
jgi:hypothetical protein